MSIRVKHKRNNITNSKPNAQKHIHNINLIQDISELKNYDYTTGYPEKHYF